MANTAPHLSAMTKCVPTSNLSNKPVCVFSEYPDGILSDLFHALDTSHIQ